jgi:hypothetical protein
MSPAGLATKNNCAGQFQQQLTRPIENLKFHTFIIYCDTADIRDVYTSNYKCAGKTKLSS